MNQHQLSSDRNHLYRSLQVLKGGTDNVSDRVQPRAEMKLQDSVAKGNRHARTPTQR